MTDFDPKDLSNNIISSNQVHTISASAIRPSGLSIYDTDGKPIFHMDSDGKLDYDIGKMRRYMENYKESTERFPHYQNNAAFLLVKAVLALHDDLMDIAPWNKVTQHLPGGAVLKIYQHQNDPRTYFQVNAVDATTGKKRGVGASVIWESFRSVVNRRNMWSSLLINVNDKYTTMTIATNEATDWILDNQNFLESMVANNPALIKRS